MNYCSLQWMPGDWGLWERWGHSWRPPLTGRTRITWSGDPALSWEVPLTSWRWWHRGGGGGEGLNCHCSWMTNTMTTLGSSISDRPLHQRVWRRSFLPAAISTAPHTPQTQCTHKTSALCTQYNNALFLCVKPSSHCEILQGIQRYVQY